VSTSTTTGRPTAHGAATDPRPGNDADDARRTDDERSTIGERPTVGDRLVRGRRIYLSLGLVVLVAAVVRALGVAWGLPLRLHPDEWVIVDGAVDLARRNSFEPQFFQRPDHVEIKLSYIAYTLYSQLVRMPVEAIAASDSTPLVAISRSITVLFGIGTVILSYLIGSRFTRAVGLACAALVALYPAFVTHSHFATPDVPLTFMVLLIAYAGMRYLRTAGWASLLVMCLAVSLSIAIKYPGAIGAAMIAVVVIIDAAQRRQWGRIVVRGLAAVGAVIGFLFLISPVLFTNVNGVVEAITIESRDTHAGADGLGTFGNLSFYVVSFVTPGGFLLAAAAVLGVFWCVKRRLIEAIPLTIGLVYWVVLSAVPLHWDRWALPMYVAPLLFAGIGIVYSLDALRRMRVPRVVSVVATIAVVLVFANLAAGTAAIVARYLLADTRQVAGAVLSDIGARQDNTIYEGYTPFVPGTSGRIFDAFDVEDGELIVSRDVKTRESREYVVISENMYQRFLDDPQYVEEQEFYRLLDEQFPKVAEVDREDSAYQPSIIEPLNIVATIAYLFSAPSDVAGPRIVVYEIPADRH
jgi:hypothetical protein